MTEFEGKMWNMIGSVGWVESDYDTRLLIDFAERNDESTLRNLATFVAAQSERLIQHIREFELETNVSFNLTDQQLAHVATEVVSRGKLTYDTYTAYPARLTGLHNNYHYTLPRLARVN